MLDHLTAELVKFGYGWDRNNTCDTEIVEETPLSHMLSTSEVDSGVESGSESIESSESASSESAESSDQSDSWSDSDSSSESDSAESWEEEEEEDDDDDDDDNYCNNGGFVEYDKAAVAIRVSVCEIDEFDD
jgi:hypothetical protein